MSLCSNRPTLQTIANLCFKKFDELPKSGKPTPQEWTILAGIVQHDCNTSESRVVSLGCGTKCIGQSKLCPKGLILNDSHAEILARRSFLYYLQNELKKASTLQDTSIFQWAENKNCFQIKNNVEFHFLSTQTPCGDACILEDCNEVDIPAAKRARLTNKEDAQHSNTCSGDDVFTGAKLIGPTDGQDVMLQKCGPLRTKPGRGERTLSMSCSDKLARWNILGVQGALLDMLFKKPIYFKTLNFCCRDANEKAIIRAIYGRWIGQTFEHERFIPQKPDIRIDNDLCFEYSQHADKNPSPNGLIWCNVPAEAKPYEVSVNGKRQGVTKKKFNTSQAALNVSKFKLLAGFVGLLRACPELLQKLQLNEKQLSDLTYESYKNLAVENQAAWATIKKCYFQQWTIKPNTLKQFSLNSEFS